MKALSLERSRCVVSLLLLVIVAAMMLVVRAMPCRADDAGEGITGARRNQPPPPPQSVLPGLRKIDDSEWMNNTLGIDDSVPAPWTPLKRDRNSISCWDRTYTFDSAFPTDLEGGQHDLLAQPMQIVAIIDGTTYRLSNSEVTFTSERGDHIDFTATGDLGPIKLRATSWIEFDGMVQIKFDLDAGAGVDVQYVGLEIPMPSSIAKYYNYANGEWGGKPLGAIGTQPGWSWSTQWWPVGWVGNDDRGLTFVAESNDGWTAEPDGSSQQIITNPDGVLWKVDLIGKPAHISGVKSYMIGLQATPMKPMRKDMAAFNPELGVFTVAPQYYGNSSPNTWPDRMFGLDPDSKESIQESKDMGINSINMWVYATRLACYPEYRDPERVKKAIANWHKAGLSVTQYWSPYFEGYLSDVYKRHEKEWAHLRSDGSPYCPPTGPESTGGAGYTTCCPRSSFGDFQVWGADYLMRNYDLDGLGYIDGPGPLLCYNELHGCAGGTYPIFRDREIFKRWYKIVKKYKPNGYIWAHMSESLVSPIMGFMDAYIVGEEFRPAVHPLTDLDKTRLAVTMTGIQWGSQPLWMSQCSAGLQENTEWVSARILPYGATPGVDWIDPSIIVPVEKAKIKFGVGLEDTKFYAPHQLPDWLKVNSKDFVIGCWQRADGDVLLIISNWDDKYKNAQIDAGPFEKSPDKFAVGEDAITGARLMTSNDQFQVCVPGNSFRTVLIKPGR